MMDTECELPSVVDMHGLIVGPDGRLYFSIGDRGYHVMTKEGKLLSDPASGAVFRCEPDGSGLELFATGLRNPQELAFDQYGNLFTGDNNSDGGDKARWVYVVEGGDTGWRMEYQYIPDRGPFNREKIWYPFHPEQPAYIVPPVENVGDGPSGLIYYPGTGLGDHYNDCFLLADFRGTPNQSGIRTIRVEPRGAHFKLAANEKLVWNILATDLALGTDSGLYISDWVDGWDGTGKGRIYKFVADKEAKSVVAEEVKSLLRGDWSKLSVDNLKRLMGHLDQRVRQAAQFELVRLSQTDALVSLAANEKLSTLARVHAIWGLGQLARVQPHSRESALAAVVGVLGDKDLQVRTAACSVLGDNRFEKAALQLIKLMGDSEPRVAHHAATACAKLNLSNAFDAAVTLLRQSNNQDPVLRHAAVLALANSTVSDDKIAGLSSDSSMPVRLGAVVSLRRRSSPKVELFLADSNLQVVAEAARAIHDMPILGAFEKLSALVSRNGIDDETLFRALNANYRLGTEVHAKRVAEVAANESTAQRIRVEAITMLVNWAKPDERDRYLNAWRPLDPREAKSAEQAIRSIAAQMLKQDEEIQLEGIRAIVAYNLTELVEPVAALTAGKSSPKVRAEAMRAAAKLDRKRAATMLDPMLADADWQVSMAALEVLADVDAVRAATALSKAVKSPELGARQAAWKLARKLSGQPAAVKLLEQGVSDYIEGKLPLDESLELLDASQDKIAKVLTERLVAQEQKWQEADPVEQWRWALAGGDPKKGKNIFLYKSEVSCLRCHKVGNQGGEVGPVLTELGAKKDARYLLEAIVLPNAKIAEGFESISILDDVGVLHSGVLKKETDQYVEYMTAEGKLQRVEKEAIEQRRKGNSAMPADIIKSLSRQELRDLVAYLSSLKGSKNEGH
ncbi:MAG: HEAT repeat domain-containing protein [Pirellulales bacterium]